MKKLALIGGLSIFLAACSSTPMNNEDAVVTPDTGVKKDYNERLVTPAEANKLDANGLPLILTDGKSVLSKRSVYFDFDQFNVKTEYQEVKNALKEKSIKINGENYPCIYPNRA